MKYRITHVTSYNYSESVSLCHNLAHLKLRTQSGQHDVTSQIRIDPVPTIIREFRDFFGNPVNYFSIQQAHQELTITATSEVEVIAYSLDIVENSIDLINLSSKNLLDLSWNNISDQLNKYNNNKELMEAKLFTLDSPFVKSNTALRNYAISSFSLERPFIDAVTELMGRIHADFTYDPNATDVATPLDTVLEQRRGVCQDFAHLAIGCLRALGLPARYVSGYLETLPPPGVPKLRGADASHAWFSIYIPQIGWLDFDPTNNIRPIGQHITTAVGRDFGDVTPIKGILYGGGEHTLKVAVDVENLM